MLKRLYALLAVLICLPAVAWCAPVPLDAEHFPDPEFRMWMSMYDSGWYDSVLDYTIGANDGVLSDMEIAVIQALNPVGKKLKGIEYLFGLKILSCRYMNLKELDVSRNYELTFLSCESNDLKELDVSNNISLTTLICNDNHLTELDLDTNTKLENVTCSPQETTGLSVKATNDGYEVCLKDYVKNVENIDVSTIGANDYKAQFISYDGEKGTVVFAERPRTLHYKYRTHSPNNDLMEVTIKEVMTVDVIERKGIEENIIFGMKDDSYLDKNGNAIKEESISEFPAKEYGKKGFVADGNSRLIVRVQTQRPGTVTYEQKSNFDIHIEKLTDRADFSLVDYLTPNVHTTEVAKESYQASVVLIAPERLPSENFPEDKFSLHVKFTADDTGEELTEEERVIEKDVELEIHAAPVLLVPGIKSSAKGTFGNIGEKGIWGKLKNNGFSVDAWEHGGFKGPSEMNYSGLYSMLMKVFESYNKRGIVCTRADIVAHGMGGLLARRFCTVYSSENAPEDGNYYSVRSYRQGMIRRLITVATPHRGTMWANYFLGDFSKLNSDVEPGIVWAFNKAFLGLGWLGRNAFLGVMGLSKLRSGTALQDMAVGSKITTGYFPAKLPMHSIYGNTKEQLELLLEVVSEVFNLSSLVRLKSVVHNWNVLWKTYKNVDFLYWEGGAVTKINKELLRTNAYIAVREYDDALNKYALSKTVSIFEGITNNKWGMALLHSIDAMLSASNPISAGLFALKLFNQMLQETLAFKEDNDFVVTKSSAQGDFEGHSTAMEGLIYGHFDLSKRDKVSDRVAELLKGSVDEFVVFDENTSPAVNSSLIASSAEDEDLKFEDVYDSCFTLKAEPDFVTVDESKTAAIKFTVLSDKPTGEDFAFLVISNGEDENIIPVASSDEKTFEVNVEFTNEYVGVMTTYCFSRTEYEKLAISNTVTFTVKLDFDADDTEEIMFMNSSGTTYVNASEDIDVNLYARTYGGKFIDISSPLLGTNWTSDNPEIAFVNDEGRVHGLKEGSTVLRAEFNGLTAVISVDVGPAYDVSDDEDNPNPEPEPDPEPQPEPKPISRSGGGGGCNAGIYTWGLICVFIIMRRR